MAKMTDITEAIALFSLDKFTEGSTAWLYWAEFNGNIDQGEAPTVEEAEAKAFAYLSQFKEITNIISKYKPEKEDYRFELDEDQLSLGYKDVDEWKQAQV
jgi:hypothetical protein